MSLPVLLARCATGDEGAFDDLYGATAPRVFGLVLRIVVQPALAEEITQDVFVYVWTQAGRYDSSRGGAVGWILTIAHRRAVDRVRSAGESQVRDTAGSRKATPTPFDLLAGIAQPSLAAERVRWALGSLALKQCTAIQLAYYQGLTYPEVAKHLGIPHGTAKSYIRDGLRSLAPALDSTLPAT